MRLAPLSSLALLTPHLALLSLPPLAAVVLLAATAAAAEGARAPQPARVPVLLELFTSEGCSSCPPADAVLARLAEAQPVPGVEVIALSEHVDYWNRLGWADPYSAALFSDRQEAYAPRISGGRVYTPQAVVDGMLNLVGSDETGLRRALAAAASRPRGTIALSAHGAAPGGPIALSIDARGLPGDGDLIVAVVEDGLVSRVGAGENQGRTLPHAAVVRSLRRLGRTSGGAVSLQAEVALDPSWQRARLRLVAFVQEPGSPVLAAAASAPGR